jgi:SAM-dependent MidA family methyltransferase
VAGAGGRVVVVDYVATSVELAGRPWTDWVRTYAGHGRGDHPLARLGGQDVTVEVCLDQLAQVRPPTAQRSQAEFLRAHGIDALVEQGRRQWAERAHLGDLTAVAARSRVTEAAALCDPTGLGAFAVLEWTAGSPEPSPDWHA